VAGFGVVPGGQRGHFAGDEAGVGHADVHDLAEQGSDRAVLLGPGQLGLQDAGHDAAAGKLDFGRLVGVVDGDHHVAAAGQVLHQGCPPGPGLAGAG
jgi:hypothetical protein